MAKIMESDDLRALDAGKKIISAHLSYDVP
jgi:hypothetical protein